MVTNQTLLYCPCVRSRFVLLSRLIFWLLVLLGVIYSDLTLIASLSLLLLLMPSIQTSFNQPYVTYILLYPSGRLRWRWSDSRKLSPVESATEFHAGQLTHALLLFESIGILFYTSKHDFWLFKDMVSEQNYHVLIRVAKQLSS
ncbi:MAG: hypothetical protein ACPHV3_02740 [Vibrio sp.]